MVIMDNNQTIIMANEWIGDYREWLTEEQSLQNAQLVANHFGSSWTPEAISAMCGNMRHESSINPDMYEFGYDWDEDRGYGLVQWTPRSKYWNWAESNNLAPRNGNSQLARIDYEKENGIQWISTASYPESFDDFSLSKKTLNYLTNAFCWNYERPNQQAGEESMPARIAFAELCYVELDFGGSPSPQPPKHPYVIRRHNTNMRRMGVRGRR